MGLTSAELLAAAAAIDAFGPGNGSGYWSFHGGRPGPEVAILQERTGCQRITASNLSPYGRYYRDVLEVEAQLRGILGRGYQFGMRVTRQREKMAAALRQRASGAVPLPED